jgi:hypothetical protein
MCGTRQSNFKKNKKSFAKCRPLGTRQNLAAGDRRHGPAIFCRVSGIRQSHLCRVQYFAECPDKKTLGKVLNTRQSPGFQ